MEMYITCIITVTAFLSSPPFATGQGDGDIRLQGGETSSEGRVEIFYDSQWGTICGTGWDLADATVACRQLGYNKAEAYTAESSVGEGSGQIWLDNVQCSGYESSLYGCIHPPWGEHECLHSKDAGVTCSNANTTTPPNWTVNGDIRLVGGPRNSEGRVEVYFEGSWHTVCDDQWDLNDARVVCRQLGYPGVEKALTGAYYGPGSGSVLLEDSLCYGYETALLNCRHDGYYDTDCSHSRDAGVKCVEDASDLYDGKVRLVGSTYPNRGRVEIYHSGQWGTVCDKRWYWDDARVICRQLGYSGVYDKYSSAHYGQGSGPIIYALDCRGYEYRWLDCPYDDWNTDRCDHGDDAAISCLTTELVPNMEGKVKLVGKAVGDTTPPPAASASYGTVQIYHNNEWGRVCDDYWDYRNADVVCRQLGYPDEIAAVIASIYGSGTGPFMLDNVRCDGWEHELSQCRRNAWYVNNCGQYKDAGVRCVLPDQYYPRLVDGGKWYEGRVEVWDGNRWERVCATNFYEEQAKTLCKQLGFNGYQWITFDNRFGVGTDTAPSDVGFYCNVDDVKLSDCKTFDIDESDYCSPVAVRCNYSGSLSPGEICGIVFACLFAVLCIAACFAAMVKQKKRRNRQMQGTVDYQTQPTTVVYSDSTTEPVYPVYPQPGPAYPPPTGPTSAAYPPPGAYPPGEPAKTNLS